LETVNQIFGLDEEKLGFYQMGCRAIFVFFIALFYMSVAGLRTFGKKSTFDQITVLMIGALLAKSIIGNESFFAVLFAALLIMLLHRVTAWVCTKNKKVEHFIKGNPLLLIKNGKLIGENLKKVHVTKLDLMETIRQELHEDDISSVKEAYLEASGEISVIRSE
jgi:uncharacterized membrane protein YcaP (DUF421 family)